MNDNPIEQVRLTVPITDDPSQPVLTFRTWLLGISSCVLLAFVNQFFGYRTNQLSVGSVSAQIVTLPLGNLMARVFPKKQIKIPLTKWSFSLNPGPFNLKEHVLITIFASTGSGGVYAVNIITAVKAFYRRPLHPVAAMLLVQTTQVNFHHSISFSEHSSTGQLNRILVCPFFSCLGMDGLGFSGNFLWIHRTCGGPQTSSKSLCSGTFLSPRIEQICLERRRR